MDEPTVTYLVQNQPIGDSPTERELAVRGMLGACIFGALEHYGRNDNQRNGTADRTEAQLRHLDWVFNRNDHGIHGHALEWAVHAALNNAAGIPARIARRVQIDVAAHAAAVFEQLGVPWIHMGDELRSVMYGIERVRRGAPQCTTRAELGPGALLWPGGGEPPFPLGSLVPWLSCPNMKKLRDPEEADVWASLPRLERMRQRDVPYSVSHLWRADLFIGGVPIDAPAFIASLVEGAPTAWLSASLKYQPGKLEGGSGLHLGIDTNHGIGQRSGAPTAGAWIGDLRLVRLRVEDSFLGVFNTAMRLLRHMGRERFPRIAHHIKFDPEWAPLVVELGRRRGELAADVAADLLDLAPVASPVTASAGADGYLAHSVTGGYRRRAPLLAPIPTTMSFAA